MGSVSHYRKLLTLRGRVWDPQTNGWQGTSLGGLGHCQLVGGVVHSVGSLCGPPSLLHAVL